MAASIALLEARGAISIPKELIPTRKFDYGRIEKRLAECGEQLTKTKDQGLKAAFKKGLENNKLAIENITEL